MEEKQTKLSDDKCRDDVKKFFSSPETMDEIDKLCNQFQEAAKELAGRLGKPDVPIVVRAGTAFAALELFLHAILGQIDEDEEENDEEE
jgi:hypothetical protein